MEEDRSVDYSRVFFLKESKLLVEYIKEENKKHIESSYSRKVALILKNLFQ